MEKHLNHEHHHHANSSEYIKLAVIILFIIILSGIRYANNSELGLMHLMTGIMGYFFVLFSLFKFLAYKDFREAYQSYDVIAKRISIYSYIYPFLELILGISYLLSFQLIYTNSFTAILMFISIIGVVKSLNKNIKCACLGTIIDLPLSNITLIEDISMGLMALLSLALLFF